MFGFNLSYGTKINGVQPNQKWDIQYGGLQTGSTYFSAFIQESNKISMAKSMFPGSSYPINLVRVMFDQIGIGKAKMAASKLQINLSQLQDKISIKFQWLHPCF